MFYYYYLFYNLFFYFNYKILPKFFPIRRSTKDLQCEDKVVRTWKIPEAFNLLSEISSVCKEYFPVKTLDNNPPSNLSVPETSRWIFFNLVFPNIELYNSSYKSGPPI